MRLLVLALLAACEPPPADPIEPSDAARAAPSGVPEGLEDVRGSEAHIRRTTQCVVTLEVPDVLVTRVHTFDRLGRIMSTVHQKTGGRGWMYRYDRSPGKVLVHLFTDVDGAWIEGTTIVETWEGGRIVGREPQGEKWAWDEAGRIVAYEHRYSEWYETSTTWAWDEAGRLTGSTSTETGYPGGTSVEQWSWDGDRLLGWSQQGWNEVGSGSSEMTWTAHDERGLPLVGEGSFVSTLSGDSTTYTRRRTEEWTWDELGRAVSRRIEDENYEPVEQTWMWGERELETFEGSWYSWDEQGRLLVLERGETRIEWEWSDQGRLVEIRSVLPGGARVERWSDGCPASTWVVPELPNPGPWPLEPRIPGPMGPLTP